MTAREWFRELRRGYKPLSVEENEAVLAARACDFKAAEFWSLMVVGLGWKTEAMSGGLHDWHQSGDGYTWVCEACGADVPSYEIGETEPPRAAFDDKDCMCKACQPCTGRT